MEMPRKAAEFWWNLPIKGNNRKTPFIVPPDVAYYTRKNVYEQWNIVTWSDVHKRRTEKIERIISFKRRHSIIKPCLMWVFLNENCFPFGGFYTAIKTLNETYYLNFRGIGIKNETYLKLSAMKCFPLYLPMIELFDEWMKLFCKAYHNSNFYHKRKTQGIAKCWCKFDEYGSLIDISLNNHSC